MLALELEKSRVKAFMNILLRGSVFEGFDVLKIEISAANLITIDGATEGDDGSAYYSSWSNLRPLVYEIIKFCSKPKFVKITFLYRDTATFHENARALTVNLTYENDNVYFTTSTTPREFTMDKTMERDWDTWVREYLAKTGYQVSDRT